MDSPIATTLKEAFVKRIDERRNPELAHLINYLNNPGYVSKGKDVLGHKIVKSKITQLATKLIKLLFPIEDDDENENNELFLEEEAENNNMTLSERLELRLLAQKQETPSLVEIGTNLVKNEMALFEKNSSKRPQNLERLYNALMTIPPTSIESERNFSTTTFFGTKIRSRLDDITLGALVFLKSYYKKNK